jgi:hypothetical protein
VLITKRQQGVRLNYYLFSIFEIHKTYIFTLIINLFKGGKPFSITKTSLELLLKHHPLLPNNHEKIAFKLFLFMNYYYDFKNSNTLQF